MLADGWGLSEGYQLEKAQEALGYLSARQPQAQHTSYVVVQGCTGGVPANRVDTHCL